MSQIDGMELIEYYQQHVAHALVARMQQTEAIVGDRFGFEVLRRGQTTCVFGHAWAHLPGELPFHRIFNYAAPADTSRDSILERCTDEGIDAVVEVLPGPRAAHAEACLRRYGFATAWRIPWLHIAVEQFSWQSNVSAGIHQCAPHELDQAAQLFVQGYGYAEASAASWYDFARHGYTAAGFACFLAEVEQQPAAFGAVHVRDAIAFVDGAATLAAYRGLGLQKALLAARIRYARERNCRYAFSRTGLGSISQQNMEKLGMRLICQSTAWRRPQPMA